MSTFSDIKSRVKELMSRRGKGSITVEETFDVINDLLEKTEAVDANAGRLSIRRSYASIAAMNADVAPTDQATSKKLKYGELVWIANAANLSDADNGKVYRWLAPGWELATKIAAPTAGGVMVDVANLEDKGLVDLQKVAEKADKLSPDIYEKTLFVYTIVDAQDRVLFGIRSDGSVFWNKGYSDELKGIISTLTERINVLDGGTSQIKNYAYLILDSMDRVVLSIDNEGQVGGVLKKYFDDIRTRIDSIVSNKIIPCWGDSLTAAGVYENEIQGQLGNEYMVYNCGVGGESSNCIAARQGALPLYLLNSVSIPADTSEVQVGDVNDSGLRILDTNGTVRSAALLRQGEGKATVNPVTIDDIECTLRWTGTAWNDPNGKYMLKRNAPGVAHTARANSLVFTNGAKTYRNPYAIVIWIGQNGGYTDNVNLVDQVKAIANFAPTGNFVTVGLHTGTAATRADLEKAMLQAFGNRYINWRDYCANRALSDAGLTPTEADVNAMLVGSCPPSLLTDGVHMTQLGYTLLGKQIINRFKKLSIV